MLRSLLFVGVLSAPVLVSAQLTTNDGIFTLDQALAGQSAYARECAACHGVGLGGGEGGNALIGSEFLGKWSSMPLSTLYAVTSLSMPVVNPGGLSQKQYQDILSYMLLANGYPAGEQSLQGDMAAMASLSMQMPEGDVDALMAQLDSHVHVPSGLTQEWPSVRADTGSSNYSSLDLINQSNVQ